MKPAGYGDIGPQSVTFGLNTKKGLALDTSNERLLSRDQSSATIPQSKQSVHHYINKMFMSPSNQSLVNSAHFSTSQRRDVPKP